MAWRPHSQARVSVSRPEAWGQCDRCCRVFNLKELQWQFQYAGTTLQNLKILVCRSCKDVPNEQLRTIILPGDPIPVLNPRPQNPVQEFETFFTSEDGDFLTTEDGDQLVTENSVPPPES